MLSHSQRIQNCSGPVLCHCVRYLLNLRLRDTGDAFTHFQRVTRNKLLEVCKNAMRIIKAGGHSRLAFSIKLITPAIGVVFLFLFVETAEESILEIKILLAEKKRVGMCPDIVVVV